MIFLPEHGMTEAKNGEKNPEQKLFVFLTCFSLFYGVFMLLVGWRHMGSLEFLFCIMLTPSFLFLASRFSKHHPGVLTRPFIKIFPQPLHSFLTWSVVVIFIFLPPFIPTLNYRLMEWLLKEHVGILNAIYRVYDVLIGY